MKIASTCRVYRAECRNGLPPEVWSNQSVTSPAATDGHTLGNSTGVGKVSANTSLQTFACFAWLLLLAGIGSFLPVRATTPPQKLENAAFNWTTPDWSVGLDGNVYLCSPTADSTGVIHVTTDGMQHTGRVLPTEAGCAVAANINGIIAVAHTHTQHCVKLYDANFTLLATVPTFNNANDDAPADVEVGEQSGDFYALDQQDNRIVRISGRTGSYGHILATYVYPTPPTPIYCFRVSEKNNLFYLINGLFQEAPSGTPIVAVNMTSLTPQWSLSYAQTEVSLYGGQSGLDGGVAVDTNGTLYTLGYGEDVIKQWSNTGAALGSVTLKDAPSHMAGTLGISHGQAIIRYAESSEAFRVFTLSSGAMVRTVSNTQVAASAEGQRAQATATWSLDTTTKGSWWSSGGGYRYGNNGYVLCGWNGPVMNGPVVAGPADVVNLTGSYVQSVTPKYHGNYIWWKDQIDPRMPINPATGRRNAASWYSAYSYDVLVTLVNPNDGVTHRMAVYCVDWCNVKADRKQTLDLLNPSTGLSELTGGPVSLSKFDGGIWVVFCFTGNVTLHVTKNTAANAVNSVIAFDN